MIGHVRGALALVSLMAFAGGPADAADSSLVTIETPRGVQQAFILIKPENPVASVVLFAGGNGALGLKSESSMRWGAGNFLVRSRDKFAAQGLMVAVVDAPSDQQQGMNAIFRMSQAHAQDIAAVAGYLRKQKDVPVWLVGTSMGTFSAADGAIVNRTINGLVLTSTITRAKPDWKIAQSHRNGVASMPLSRVRVPTLIMSHRNDGCEITPASDAPKLRKRLRRASVVEGAVLDGGNPPQSEACEGKSQHGYFGIENEAVTTIAKFVAANGK